jgi:nicotinamidase-related amidase
VTDQSRSSPDAVGAALFPTIADPILRPAKTALLVVDMTKAQAHPGYGLGELARSKGMGDTFRGYYNRVAQLVPNVVKMREAVGALGGEVIHIRTVTQTSQMTELSDAHRAVGHCVGICPAGSPEAEILDDLQPTQRDILIDKISISPFNSSPLDQVLRNLGIDIVIVTGVRTNEAIELTAHGAADRGYWAILASDGCTTVSEELHGHTLRHVSFGMIKVKTTEEILRMLLYRDWSQCA